ncbi:MAG: tetratricopeptide repeat protein [Methanospirillum sp.]|nr:tetratricopeptide repeat protein [Methanospirillum sp.]
MPPLRIIFLLLATFTSFGMVCIADSENIYYSGVPFDPELVPSGMIPYEEGWSHGSLFSAPNWLLAQIDSSLTSSVLDYGATPAPTKPPKDYEGYISEGYAALEGGNYRDAYTAFKKATELDLSSSDAWYGTGIALESQGRYLSSLEAYGKAISLSRSASDNWASFAGKGRSYYYLNRFEEARTALETAIRQYEKAGVSHPDELDEIYRLLEEINQKIENRNTAVYSPYIPQE